MTRPRPPANLLEETILPVFTPAPELLAWAIATFIDPDAPLHNPDHLHLLAARVGMLWTNVANARNGRSIVGQCEFKPPGGTMGKWARARAESQILGWFGEKPDFLITLDASYASACSDDEFCALLEHELYHAGQAKDEFGAPAFSRDGMPVFAMRGHDVEEFIGVVKRYGADAAHVRELVEAANRQPEIAAARIGGVCGTCLARAA